MVMVGVRLAVGVMLGCIVSEGLGNGDGVSLAGARVFVSSAVASAGFGDGELRAMLQAEEMKITIRNARISFLMILFYC